MSKSKDDLFSRFEPEKETVKNLDLLFTHINMLKASLHLKKEDAEAVGDYELKRFIEGQLVGVNYAKSILEAFFDY